MHSLKSVNISWTLSVKKCLWCVSSSIFLIQNIDPANNHVPKEMWEIHKAQLENFENLLLPIKKEDNSSAYINVVVQIVVSIYVKCLEW